MNLEGLQAFLAVAETESFSLAADQLHLSQPAISKRIAGLEDELRVALFDRISRRVTLTEAGKLLFQRANRILFEVEDARRSLSNLTGNVAGRLRIGTSHHIGLHRLPPVLRQFSSHFPSVQLDLKFFDSEDAFDAVNSGELELGIVTLPSEPHPLIEMIEIWHDPLSITVGKDHPLAQKRKISISDLADFPAILPGGTTITRKIVESLFEPFNLKILVAMSTNYLETNKMMAAIGLGWTVLPESMLDKDLRKLTFKNFSMTRELGVIYHPKHSLSNAAREMVKILKEQRINAKK